MNRFQILKTLHQILAKSEIEEVNLWREVIRQAFIDLLIISDHKKHESVKKEALKWLKIRNKDYLLVCQLAEIEEMKIHYLFKQARLLKLHKLPRIKKHISYGQARAVNF